MVAELWPKGLFYWLCGKFVNIEGMIDDAKYKQILGENCFQSTRELKLGKRWFHSHHFSSTMALNLLLKQSSGVNVWKCSKAQTSLYICGLTFVLWLKNCCEFMRKICFSHPKNWEWKRKLTFQYNSDPKHVGKVALEWFRMHTHTHKVLFHVCFLVL